MQHSARVRNLAASLSCVLLGATGLGVSAGNARPAHDPIFIAQTLPLSGPAAALAREVGAGRRACLDAVNARGGVNGRQLVLETADDAGSSVAAIRTTKSWADEARIVAMLGPMGADVNQAVLQIAARNGLLVVGPVDGDIGSRVVAAGDGATAVFLTANQSAEAQSIVRHLGTLGLKRVAVVVGLDAPGRAAQVAFDEALGVLGLTPAAVIEIRPDGGNAQDAAKAVQSSTSEAVLLATTGVATVAFIDAMARARQDGPVPLQFYGMSTALTPAGLARLGRRAYGLSMTTVLPSYDDPTLAAAETFRRAMKTAGSAPSPLSFEGCLGALALTRILSDAGTEPSRASTLKAARALANADLGGLSVDLRPSSGRVGGNVDMWFVDSEGRLRR